MPLHKFRAMDMDGLMRVLVVEDEKRLAASLKSGLEADSFVVDVAPDGTDGLWMAQEHDYDAIVLDIMLPGVNGFGSVRRCARRGTGRRS